MKKHHSKPLTRKLVTRKFQSGERVCYSCIRCYQVEIVDFCKYPLCVQCAKTVAKLAKREEDKKKRREKK